MCTSTNACPRIYSLKLLSELSQSWFFLEEKGFVLGHAFFPAFPSHSVAGISPLQLVKGGSLSKGLQTSPET